MNFDILDDKIKYLKKVDVLISVNINGKNAILNKLDKKDLIIIEDCAQSFLSTTNNKNKKIKISCYSTGTTKLMNTFRVVFYLIIKIYIKNYY